MIGATYVGSCKSLVKIGDTLEKGADLGEFRHGGSSVVLMFREGVAQYDGDLKENSLLRIETFVKVGTQIARMAKKEIKKT
jgi:phosphatidylserine decarboxylase